MSKIIKKLYIILSILSLILLYGCAKEPEVVIEKYETTSIKEVVTEIVSLDTIESESTSMVDDETAIAETVDEEYEIIPLRKGENKMVVTYCTFSGYTKKVAKMIENYYHKKNKVVDLYEIEPKVPYTEKDLDYMDKNSRCSKEHDKDLRPELLDQDFNISKHEVVFVGFPVWWGLSPQIVYTFLESYDFEGKTIVPF
ncbi:MAG: NAD(P)H-dependent oxidoreductase, partial [Lachnospiraceae bacterium]|nr:NAD(P)H-dependent oxidoreductase [Lachnospiraceae bacterium]